MHLVVIPTYNELDNIEKLLARLYAEEPDFNVLIVDDASPDGTGALVKKLMKKQYKTKLFLLERSEKKGLGSAYIAGFKWALERSYQYIFEMDGDLSHNPKYLQQFMAVAANCDVVLGSRYVRGGGVMNRSCARRLISFGGSLYTRMILGMPFKDITGGFKCFHRSVLEQIPLDTIFSSGYSFQIEMTYRAFLKGFVIKEVPIRFEDRVEGKSKMSFSIFIEALFLVWKLRVRRGQFISEM